MTDFIFLGSKITADSDGSPEIKKQLLLGRKAMTNIDSVLKNRDITLLTKVWLKLKLQYFGHLIRRANSLEKTPRLGKYVLVKVFIKEQEEKRATENKMVGGHHRLNGYEFEQILETEKDRAAWHAAVHGVTKSRTRLST